MVSDPATTQPIMLLRPQYQESYSSTLPLTHDITTMCGLGVWLAHIDKSYSTPANLQEAWLRHQRYSQGTKLWWVQTYKTLVSGLRPIKDLLVHGFPRLTLIFQMTIQKWCNAVRVLVWTLPWKLGREIQQTAFRIGLWPCHTLTRIKPSWLWTSSCCPYIRLGPLVSRNTLAARKLYVWKAWN